MILKMYTTVAVFVICSISLCGSLKCFGCHGSPDVCEENAVETVCTEDLAHTSAKTLLELGYHQIDFEQESSKFKCFHETAKNTNKGPGLYIFKGCIFDIQAKSICKTNLTRNNPLGTKILRCYFCSSNRCNEYSRSNFIKIPAVFIIVISLVIHLS